VIKWNANKYHEKNAKNINSVTDAQPCNKFTSQSL